MNQHAEPTFAERLERLERENRRWRWGGATTLAVGLAITIAGANRADVPKVIEAELFVVRDQDGKERGRFGMARDGASSHLSLCGKDGQDRAYLHSNPDDVGGLLLYGIGGKLSVAIGAESEAGNTPNFNLRTNEGQFLNLGLRTLPGQPVMTMTDKDRRVFEVPMRLLRRP